MIKTSKEQILDYIKHETAKGNGDLDTVTISNALNMQRTNVSAILNQLVAEEYITKTKTRPVYYSLPADVSENDCFSKMIGYDGSLSNAVQLAKAAILYPVKSLNTLIVGNSGTGKGHLANLMFEYAQRMGKVSKGAIFRKINCRHFVNNPQGLVDQLFAKPTDTQRNMIDASENSILFIDNIDSLDGFSIGRINTFIELGYYYYLDGTRAAPRNVMLIISIDRKANLDLLQSMNSKIPVRIELPELKQRPMQERFDLINYFFIEEAIITKHDISIEPNVLNSLLLTQSPLNLKFLSGAIKVAVANAYLRCYDNMTKTIQVVIGDFEREVSDALLQYRNNQDAIAGIIPKTFNYTYSKDGYQANTDVEWSDFYEYLNRKASTLQKQNIGKDKIDEILSSDISMLVSNFKTAIRNAELNINQLSKVVDPTIITIVTEFIRECSTMLGVDYPNSVIYGLCLHINAISKSKREQKYLSIDKVNEVIKHHPDEYEQATNLADHLKTILGKHLSVDEIVMLAMFLIHDEEKAETQYPQVLIAMHGDSAASSITAVVNNLVKTDNTFAYDMPLHKDSETAYQELKALILEIDQGKGVLVIYDMGSLKTMLERVMSEIENEIRLIYVPITLIGLDASRKASMDSDIDTVYHNLLSSVSQDTTSNTASQVAIITLCHTGDGGAVEIKEYLQKNYRKDIKIYALAITERKKLVREVQRIKRYYEVKAFVGTYDPKLFGIPFIPVSKIFENNPKDLDQLILSNMKSKEIDFEQMLEYLHSESEIDIEKLKKTLPETIEEMDALFGLNVDQQVGMFLHIGALINRLVQNLPLIHKEESQYIWNDVREDYKNIKGALSKIERTFNIIVPDTEIMTLYEIVRKDTEHE